MPVAITTGTGPAGHGMEYRSHCAHPEVQRTAYGSDCLLLTVAGRSLIAPTVRRPSEPHGTPSFRGRQADPALTGDVHDC